MERTFLATILLLFLATPAFAHNGETPPPLPGGPPRGGGLDPGGRGRGGSGPTLPGTAPVNTGSAYGWGDWWARCSDGILDLTQRRIANVTRAYTKTSPHFFGKGGQGNVRRTVEEDPRGPILKALIAAADDPDDNISSSAIVALGKSRSPQAIPVLIRQLRTGGAGRSTIRLSAVLALGLAGPKNPTALGHLRAILLDRNAQWRLRAYAAVALGFARDRASVPNLWRLARAGRERLDVRACCLVGLGLVGDQIILPDLAALVSGPPLLREKNDYLRTTAASALQKLGSRAAVPALIRALSDDHRDVRRQAVLSLGALAVPSDSTVVNALLRVLMSERDNQVRAYAAAALGEIGSAAAAPALMKAYRTEQKHISNFAVLGLGLLLKRSQDAVLREQVLSVLRPALVKKSDADRQSAVAIAIGIASDREAIPVLLSIYKSRSVSRLRRAIAMALAYLDAQIAIPDLREDLEPRGDHALQHEIAKALGLLGDRESGDIMTRFLKKGASQHVRASAALSLGYLLPPEKAGDLIATLASRTEAPPVRNLAAVALGIILDWDNEVRITGLSDHLNPMLPIPALHEIGSLY